jgi:mannosyltransferase
MTSPSGSSAAGQAVASGEGSTATVTSPANGVRAGAGPDAGVVIATGGGRPARRGFDAGSRWARYLPPVIALAFAMLGITTPSYWRDEAATIAAVRRPFGDLITMLGNVDAVHSLYYMMMWPVEHLLGPGALPLRVPSAVAAVVATAAVAAIGRRLISPWGGLLAGLTFAVLPVVSRYGQEARSNEMVIALAAVASYVLIRLFAAEPDQRRRWIIGYGVSIAALGVMNIFGLLLVPAHAITVALYCRRDLRDPATKRLAIGWVVAVAAGAVVASPLLAYGWMQRGQIAWLSVNTSSSGADSVFSLTGSFLVSTAMIAVVAVSLVLASEKGRQRRGVEWPGHLVALSVPWLLVPPFILFAASVVHPVYTSRYILICIPAITLVTAAAIASFRRLIGAAMVAVILLAGATTQAALRGPAGHYDDIQAIDQIVAADARPGDAVLYTNPNSLSFGAAYSYGLGKLRNVGIAQGPIASGTLAGTVAPMSVIKSRLARVKRLWVVEINSYNVAPYLVGLDGLPVDNGTPVLDGTGLVFSQSWHEHGDYLILYTRV